MHILTKKKIIVIKQLSGYSILQTLGKKSGKG